MARPDDLRYSPTHEWVRAEGDIAVVGITDHAVAQLSDLAFVDLPRPGTTVERKGRFGEIESVKAVSDLVSPVSGEIVAVHDELTDSLDLISSSPFTEGWMIRVRMSHPAELDDLMTAADYTAHVAAEEH